MVPDGCTAATQHSTECLTPCDGVTGVWWGPCALGTLEHGEMVGPVCMAVTHHGCPRQPHLLDCLHPWQLSPLIQLGYASFFMKHWRKCEVNETGSAGSLANYLFMSVVDFHTSIPSPSPLKAASWTEVWVQKSLDPNSSDMSVISPLQKVSREECECSDRWNPSKMWLDRPQIQSFIVSHESKHKKTP